MKELIRYMLETLACSGVLLGAYVILLERRVKFRWCRWYLILSMGIAALIPLLQIPVWKGKVVTLAPMVEIPQQEVWTGVVVADVEPVAQFSPELYAGVLYLLGVALMLSLMVWQVLRIRGLRRDAEISSCDGFRLVRTRQKIASFSFFRTIYVWEQTPQQELEAILMHEASHIAHRHSVERIVMECLKAVLWWNPFVWIASRRLTEAEEFEADSDVLDSGYDVSTYINTIFKQLFGYSPEIANGLRDSLTKKRFKMMTTQTKSRYSLLRLAGTIPAVIGLLCAFSFTSRAAVVQDAPEVYMTPVFLLNGQEVAVEQINEVDPYQLVKEYSKDKSELSAEYLARGVDYVHAFTTKGVPQKGKKINFKGRVHYPDGRPVVGAAVNAGVDYSTVVANNRKEQDRMTKTDARGNFTIKAPVKGFVMSSDNDFSIRTTFYEANGTDPFTMDIEQPFPDSTKWESVRDAKGNVTLLPQRRPQKNVEEIVEITPKSKGTCKVSLKFIAADKKGAISSENKVPGVIVTLVGSQNGVVSDKEGKAEIEVPQGSVMEVVMAGYKTLAVVAPAKAEFSQFIILEPEDAPEKESVAYIRDQDGVKQKPLIIVDGLEVTGMDAIDVGSIDNMSVLKGDSATALYGDRGKYGVVIVTTNREKKIAAAQNDPETPFLVAETMPSFQGGDLSAFRTWVNKEVKYPADMLAKGIGGRVVLSFTVNVDGSVSDVQMLQSPDKVFSEEARRVVESSSGMWTPGEQRGQKVRVKYTLPVDFRAAETNVEKPKALVVSEKTNEPFRVAEVMPKFQGGDINAFRGWVQTQVKYPVEALKNNVSGRVIVEFTVGSDGRVTPGKVLSTPDRLLSEEVLRVVAKSPNWTPGEQGGKAVTVVFTMPINFGISTSKGMQIEKSEAPKGSIDEVVVVSYGEEKK